MKALLYIMVLAMFLVSSCATSGFHMGGEYDDLYYSSTDNAVVSNPVTTTTNTSTAANQQLQKPQQSQQQGQNFDNKYAADTLYADNYSDQVDMDNALY